jgi:hypothetical protein
MSRTCVTLAALAAVALAALATAAAEAEERGAPSAQPQKRHRPLATGPNDFIRPPPGPERPYYYRPPPEIAPPMQRVPQVAPLSPRVGN